MTDFLSDIFGNITWQSALIGALIFSGDVRRKSGDCHCYPRQTPNRLL
jgi:hypothetical protein